ncbi:MAG: TonB-dependent receptor [Candidatus Omnitrophica bacterium]|nr:TonB-dependent receptor [Candidatus Omnitrophota bacterium]
MKFIINIIIIFISFFYSVESSASNIELEPIIIEKNNFLYNKSNQYFPKDQISNLPVFSPEELPNYFSAVDLKKRAPFGIQQDLSIRGSIFENNNIQIEGIKINDPQTGHFSLELPLTAADIKQIGINKNRQQLNYQLKQPKEKGTLIGSSFGEHALWENFFSTNFSLGKIKNRLSTEHKISSGGRPDADFEIYNFSFHSLWQEPDKEAEFIFGSTERDFGANSFYSQSAPQEEEHTIQRFFLLKGKLEKKAFDLSGSIYFRRHSDKFILDRHDPSSYTNYHTTYIYGVKNKIIFKNNIFLGLDLRKEKITSTNLGNHSRINKGFSLGVEEKRERDFIYQVSAGIDYYKPWGYLEDINLDLGYYLKENLLIKFSYGRIWRVPSFTELYYVSDYNLGNSSLDIQKSNNYQLGLKFRPLDNIDLSLDFFMRNQSDTIDWVKNTSGDPWRAKNIGSLEARGFDFYGELKWNKGLLKRIGLGYTYLDLVKENNFNFSKYVFDYNQHKICTNLSFDLFGVNSNLIINFSKPVSRDKYTTVDLKLSKQFSDFQLSLEGVNIFNQDYQEKTDIEGTGRWYKISLTHIF